MGLRVAVAATLTIGTVPARSDAPSANTLGNSVLPALPEPPNGTATPELGPAAPALSGASASPPVNAPAPTISEAPSGAPEAAAEPLSAAEQLAAARREAIAAASRTQECERTLVAIEHEIALLASDADARRRSLAESRAEQARLLGTILHRVRSQAHDTNAADALLVERLRAEALMRDADPALRAQLRALTGEIARLDALRKRIADKKSEEAAAQQALATARERLAAAVARRSVVLREMLPPQSIDAALRIADTEREAKSIGDLIKHAEAAEEKSGKPREPKRAGRSRSKPAPPSQASDPTRPGELRSLSEEAGSEGADWSPSVRPQDGAGQGRPPTHPPLVPPVAGTVIGRGGGPGAPMPNEGLSLDAIPGATVVAPFDGRILYVGPFRDLGRVLIIRHDRRYYSVLVGLGRADAKLGDWVLAGEPVGAMPDIPSPRSGAEAREAQESDPGRSLYYELRRDSRPVDPQPWLASVEDRHDERSGEQKVGQ
jgi:septal ring factor EnvC (AmiA/AmiB activator)